jgi:uncharacterized protein YegP (UPF0339 family)
MASHRMAAIPRGKAASQHVPDSDHLQFHVYLDVFGGWRWEFRGADGNFADCRESYDSRAECIAAARAAARRSVIGDPPKPGMPRA